MKGDNKQIKTGWARLDEETKKRLSNLGIRNLQRTPGKLINARGYIPGAVGAFGTVWGKLQMTGDIAEKNLGFRPKEGAVGVLLSRRRYVDANGKVKTGIFATSLMPREITPTQKMCLTWERIRVLGKMESKHMRDIIYPIWEPLVTNKSRKPWDGPRYFMSANVKNIGPSLNWGKLLISNGELSPPTRICPHGYDKGKKEFHIIVPQTVKRLPVTMNQIGIGVFDIITGDLFHITPEQITQQLKEKLKARGIEPRRPGDWKKVFDIEPLKFTWNLEQMREYYTPIEKSPKKCHFYSRFYIYNYYKRGKLYSASISSKVRRPGYKIGYKKRRGIHIIIFLTEETRYIENEVGK